MRWSAPLVLVALSCGSSDYGAAPSRSVQSDEAFGGAPAPAAEEREIAIIRGSRSSAKSASPAGRLADAAGDGLLEEQADGDDEAPGDDGGDAVRRWFPEAFLWQPLVETDASGTAKVPVRVPDTLTTWRVLALAHSQGGLQAGTLATFDSRIPIYVDPVVPGWLYAGDRVELPVQVVNATAAPVRASLDVVASGALAGIGTGEIALRAGGSEVRWVPVSAASAGTGAVLARIGDHDAAERTIPIAPAGRPVERSRGGLIAGERTFGLDGPASADPSTQELGVLVFPGPLAVVHAEVARAASGGATPAEAAYGFALAANVEALAARAGVDLDATAQRKLRLLAWQRVVRHARAPDAGNAADLLAAMRDVGDQELAETVRQRLVRVVVDAQRGDGTWARQATAPLQRVLVQTAFAARALPETERGARLRASGAMERYASEIHDPYTAAVVLASGLLDGALAKIVRERLVEAVEIDADGSARSLSVPVGVTNPWGVAPSATELQAWATLALADADDLPWRADLVAPLMGAYDASRGFGAGGADVIALEAVTRALPGLDRPVEVVLRLDGVEVARQALDPQHPKQPALLIARPGGLDRPITLTVEPEVSGLAYVATLASWVPWTGKEQIAGVEVEVTATPLEVGRDGRITLRVAAPSGLSVTLEQGLPAGASVDETALSGHPGLVEVRVGTDRLTLRTRPARAGEILEIPIVVRPAFAGTFSTPPLVVDAGHERIALAPMVWRVSREGGVASR